MTEAQEPDRPGLLARILRDHRFAFLVVGGVNTVVGFGLFVAADLTVGQALDTAGLGVVGSLATLLSSHLIAAVLAFFLYRRFVFKVTGNLVVDFLRFESVYAVSLTANAVILPLVVQLGANRIIAQAAIIVCSTAVSYVGHRFFSFRRPADEA